MLFAQRVPAAAPPPEGDALELYDAYLRGRRAFKQDFCALARERVPAGRLLEISGGWGYAGLDVVAPRPDLRLCVLGPGEGVLALARERAAAEGQHERWRAAGGREIALPFRDGSFDGALAVNALHVWSDPAAVLREMRRVVRPGGVLLLSDLRRNADEFIAEYVVREMRADDSPLGAFGLRQFVSAWRASYTPEEVEGLLREAGLADYAVEEEGALTLTVTVPAARRV
jgi:ubiquinone/menaquinone biosynthesis C-methylase UbiE